MGPGLTAFTRTQSAASSLAQARVSASTGALVALYTDALAIDRSATTLAMLTTLPRDFLSNGSATRVVSTTPRTLVSHRRLRETAPRLRETAPPLRETAPRLLTALRETAPRLLP